jgi:cell division transport system permease protein
LHHRYAFTAALRHFFQKPITSFLIVGVIGFSLILPASLAGVWMNLSTQIQAWNKGLTLSLYLKKSVTPVQAQTLVQQLRTRQDIAQVTMLTPAQAIAEFEKQTGISGSVAALNENPLPTIIEIHPAAALQSSEAVEQLYRIIQQSPEVDEASMDKPWVDQLYTWTVLAQRLLHLSVWSLLVGAGLILMHIFRGLVRNASHNVAVIRSLGGNQGFIRRSFLYMGALYGLLGSVFAWVFIVGALRYLHPSIVALTALYEIPAVSWGVPASIVLFLMGGGLGLLAAGFACLALD